MEDRPTVVEYGVPIDPKVMIEPPDPDTHRLEMLGPPLIDYTPEETRIWRDVSPKLDELHRAHACSLYLEAKDALGISTREIPQLRDLSVRLEQETEMHLVPAEGPLAYRTFYGYIAQRGFPSDSAGIRLSSD